METSFDIDLNIIKKIGNGSFSNVYLCNRKDDCNSLLIVKKIDINELVKKYTNKGKNKKIEKKSESILEKEKEYYSSKLNELIKSEIEILSRIDHQHIVAFYGSFNKKSIYYLKMENNHIILQYYHVEFFHEYVLHQESFVNHLDL